MTGAIIVVLLDSLPRLFVDDPVFSLVRALVSVWQKSPKNHSKSLPLGRGGSSGFALLSGTFLLSYELIHQATVHPGTVLGAGFREQSRHGVLCHPLTHLKTSSVPISVPASGSHALLPLQAWLRLCKNSLCFPGQTRCAMKLRKRIY